MRNEKCKMRNANREPMMEKSKKPLREMFDPVLVLPSLPFRTYETLVESYVPVCTYLSMHARPCRASNCIYECMLKSWEGEDYSPLVASIVHRFLLHIKLWKPLRIEHRTFLANQSYDAFSLPLPASPCLSTHVLPHNWKRCCGVRFYFTHVLIMYLQRTYKWNEPL